MFVNGSNQNENLPWMLPTKFRFIWLSGFREEYLKKNQPIGNKNCLWLPYLLTGLDEIRNFYRGLVRDVSYEVSNHFGQAVSEKNFRNRTTRNKNWLWLPCLLTDRDKMCSLYGGHSIDASYQVSVDLAKWFQTTRFNCEMLTDDGRQKAMWT